MAGPLENFTFSSANRMMTLASPLDEDDIILLAKVSVCEEISELFTLHAELYSPSPELDFNKIIGQSVSLSLETPGGGRRRFNGVVSNFRQGDTLGSVTAYSMEVSPWYWFLSQTRTCRIFPNQDTPSMTIKDILQDVFSQYSGFLFDLQFDMESPVAYCVQYNESDFDFTSRIMEESGLGYYFTHAEESHTLVVFNQSSVCPECPDHTSVRYRPTTEGAGEGLDTDTIKSFCVTQNFHPGRFTTSDFNPNDPGDHKQPGASLMATTSVTNLSGGKGDFEIFQFPGRFELLLDGESLTKQLACVAEQHSRRIDVECECAGFTSGHSFEMKGHPRNDYNGQYLVCRVEHTMTQPIGIEGMDYPIHYSNKTTCLPLFDNQIPFMPEEKTAKPIITGVQVAVVASPSGKGLDLDEQGRILVKFPWDRAKNTTSCRVRVSQNQAGSNWGSMSAPHTGQEVLVAFLGGDPDRPIVVGRVYNAANVAHLPIENQTRTQIKNHGGVMIEMEGGPVPDVE